MATFSDTWNASFEALPTDGEVASQGASRIRDLKVAVSERLEIDHSWAGDGDDGEHKQVTFQGPISTPTNATNKGFLYTKDVNSKAELHFLDEDGNELQITSGGLLQSAANLGDIIGTFRSTALTGWYFLNGDTIGNSSSGATHANANLENLFIHLWDNLADAQAAVSGGRGASGSADFAANKTLTLPDYRGRGPIGAGTGSGLTARTIGDTGGAETHQLTEDEMPAHTHTGHLVTTNKLEGSNSGVTSPTGFTDTVVNSTGGDAAHNNMQPWIAQNWMIFGGT